MKILALLAALAAAVVSGGWFFRRAPVPPPDATYASTRGDSAVHIRHDASQAFDAAERAAAELRAAGWADTPVSAGTFHLLTRGADVMALVAEDLPSGGSRITTLHRRHALW